LSPAGLPDRVRRQPHRTHGGLGALAVVSAPASSRMFGDPSLISACRKPCGLSQGALPPRRHRKDMILALIACRRRRGTGYAVEYAGAAISELPFEGR